MWNYEKRLQFPVNITRPNAKIRTDHHQSVWRTRWRGGRIVPLSVTEV